MLPEVSKLLSDLGLESKKVVAQSMSAAFAADPERFTRFHVLLDDVLYDYSKQRITPEVLAVLVDLAKAAGVEARRDAMFSGAIVNVTEKRAALHTALRDFSGRKLTVEGRDVGAEVEAERGRMLAFAEEVRNGVLKGATGEAFTDVVNIGIGGSDLGPAMAARALSPYALDHLRAHFVSNVDGADIADTLAGLDPARTLFIISSKTFTTQETMTNARTARAWIEEALGVEAIGAHFAAVSTRLDKVAEFGIAGARVFGFWDWVGGRYSIWSSIGLPLAISVGADNYLEFLHGGFDVDQHFLSAPVAANIPMLMGLLSVWNRNVLGHASQAVIPYDQRLGRFPAYLQQLQMESNGKGVDVNGVALTVASGAVIWGEPGTNGQHAFFQLIHQGTEIIPVDFLVAARPTRADPHHHDLLIANCLAQSDALMIGRSTAVALALAEKGGASLQEAAALAPHKTFSGSRPTSTFLYEQLDPRTLGRLIALYEHKVFVEAAIWNINPFDQWGVELGKELASQLAPAVADSEADLSGINSSTAGLIAHMRRLRG
jgi:glucose-6-phosphate isomerase